MSLVVGLLHEATFLSNITLTLNIIIKIYLSILSLYIASEINVNPKGVIFFIFLRTQFLELCSFMLC